MFLDSDDAARRSTMLQVPPLSNRRAWCWLAAGLLAVSAASARTPVGTSDHVVVRAGGADGVRLQIHRPAAAGGSATPALVYLHGGGWISGQGSQFAPRARALVERTGWTVVTVDYPLVNDPRASTAGAQAAVCALLTRAAALGLDGRRIALAGASAGGQLAVAAVMADAHTVPECADVRRDAVQALVLFGPVLQTEGKWSNRFGHDLSSISPISLVSAALPPTLILQGSADRTTPLRVAERFVERARRAGAPSVELVRYAGRDHDFHQRVQDADARDAMDRAIAFLRARGWP